MRFSYISDPNSVGFILLPAVACLEILFDPALVNFPKEAKIFIAALDTQIKCNGPLHQNDEFGTDITSKKFLAIKRKSQASTSATLSSSDTVNQLDNLCKGDLVGKDILLFWIKREGTYPK